MNRKPDWMARLQDAVDTAHVLPFSYGLHDCCTFAAHCVDSMCGTELVSRMQRDHPYRTEEDAYEHIAASGGLRNLVTQYLGEPMHNVLLAQPGDIALTLNHDSREIVGVIIGHNVVVPGSSGLVSYTTGGIMAAWRV